MATVAASPTYAPSTYAGEQTGLWSWLTTVDHKRIGVLYLVTALGWFLIGGLEAMIIRMQLQGPNGALVSAETYNQLFTMHGTTMIFLAVMPLSAAFFNFLIPLQIGARDVAFPRLNAFSYWVFLFGGLLMNFSWLMRAAPDGGWFGYVPLTTRAYSPGPNMDFWNIGLMILGVSSLAAAFNFLTTIINLRAPGMHLMRMPMFTWMSFVVQFLLVLAFPVLTIAQVFLLFDRMFGTTFYAIAAGADPLLWQHLFWVFGHPEVYILILPAFGLVSEVLPTFSKKPLFGYPVMVYSGVLIGFLGFGVWAHHMFAVGMGAIADSAFALTTMLIAIPTGVKIFNWIFTMWGGAVRFTVAMKFAIALVALFTIGGISGIMHSSPPADLQQTDTYFIVAHFHYVLFGGSMMGIFAGLYYYFPKFTGRLMSERLGNWHFWTTFVGMNVTFFPMHFSGMFGMPRRIYRYDSGQGWEVYNLMSSIGAYLLGISTLILVYNMWKSWRRGVRAGNDPWGAPSLEWSIPSPPPEYNFVTIPTVTSRYPLWDVKHPERTTDVPHTHRGDRHVEVEMGGKDVGSGKVPGHDQRDVEELGGLPAENRSAKELGIPMPLPTIKPMIVSIGLTIMFAGLLPFGASVARASAGAEGAGSLRVIGVATMLIGAVILVVSLYSWLLSPLEEPHEAHTV